MDVMSGYVTGDPYWLPNQKLVLEATRQALLRCELLTLFCPADGEAAEICQQNIQQTVQYCKEWDIVLNKAVLISRVD
jgi:amidase